MSRRRRAGVAPVLVLAVALLGAACGADNLIREGESTGTFAPTTVTSTTSTPSTTTTTVDPGTLAQTDAKPTASGSQWDAHVAGLWQAIVTDDPTPALPFFFPLTAYRQVKGISDPDHDHATRLIPHYEDDIHALHRKLGADASTAMFVSLDVNPNAAQWIKPGVEYNKGAYWRVMNSTLRYSVDGKARSFPVVSMISWRGEWYLVHLSSVR